MIGVQTNRFHRPVDLRATRRNHRQLQARKLLIIAANVTLALTIAVIGTWIYRRTQSDRRFSVQRVEAVGAIHTSSLAIKAISARYVGTNLFRLDIEQVRHELMALPWVERVAIEKRIPDTLAIHVFERQPVALLHGNGSLRYVDHHGVGFAPLSVAVGDPELPVINLAADRELPRTVTFLEQLRASDGDLYSRISEISPIEPDGFVIFDRELQTYISVGGAETLPKWRALYAIARSEGYAGSGVEYADLRFEDRVIVKPRKLNKLAPASVSVSTGITN